MGAHHDFIATVAPALNPLPHPPVLTIERAGTVTWLTLNRPRKANALNLALNQALIEACRGLGPETAIVVLQGAGNHFCGGSDLLDLYQVDRAEAARVIKLEIDACHALAALPQLTVAMLHGKCYGGGAILPLYCDLRIGRSGVEFCLPEVGLGWAPPYGIERMESQLGRSFAIEMLLSGRTCNDQEALRHGWIAHLLAADPAEGIAYVNRLAQPPAPVLPDTLGLVSRKDLSRIKAADSKALEVFLDHFDTDHARAQIARFVEKKRP